MTWPDRRVILGSADMAARPDDVRLHEIAKRSAMVAVGPAPGDAPCRSASDAKRCLRANSIGPSRPSEAAAITPRSDLRATLRGGTIDLPPTGHEEPTGERP